MTTLDRYIARTVAAHVALALGALVTIFSVVALADALSEVGTGRYGVGDALLFVLLTLPMEAWELFPAAALVGVTYALGGMAARNEITALFAGGISRVRLLRSVAQIALLLIVVTLLAGEWLAIPLAAHARERRSVALSSGAAVTAGEGLWARDGQRFLNARAMLGPDLLGDVHLFELDTHRRLASYVQAAAARVGRDALSLHGGVRHRFADSGVTREPVERVPGLRGLAPEQLTSLAVPPDALGTATLRRRIVALAARGESPLTYQVAFWRRIAMPLTTLAMVVLGIPLVLTVGRDVSTGRRLLAGALLGIGFQLVSDTVVQIGVAYALPPALTALLPATLAAAVGGWLLVRTT